MIPHDALRERVATALEHGDPGVSISFELAQEISDALPQEREKWEYIWCHVLTPSELNKWGDDGWQLCYGYNSMTAYKQSSQYCFFKRRK